MVHAFFSDRRMRGFSGTRCAFHPALVRMPRPFKVTDEQEAVIDAVVRGGDLKIKAYAGAGKTSTLGLVADQLTGRRGSYLAFNREIAGHARRRHPSHVGARTMHSVARASVPLALRARIGLPSEPPHELGYPPLSVQFATPSMSAREPDDGQ
ncbi:hypothetical protein BZM27_42345 [Paraburkholderia steynii]|uniref:DNA helicase n=1 Tax=Paraburkholderia steynii TaxID=1245441 RepID=A0A4R0XBS9_9BURK|nr:hypothetical protein BZM27_42345 [Paraburkholderia steynii]